MLARDRAPAARLVLRREALELLRPDPAAGARAPPRSAQAYVASGHQIRPVLEAILRSPQLYEGAADDQAARRPARRHAARARAPDHRRGVGVAGRRRRPAALPPARRLRLGRQALAGLQHDPRALGPRQLRRRRPLDQPGLGRRAQLSGRDARAGASPPRARSGSTRAWSRRRPSGCSRSRASSSRRPTPRAPRRARAPSAPRCARSARTPSVTSSPPRPITRPADARSHLHRLRLRRLLPLRAPARRRGHGRPRPARDRGRHAAARRHRPLAALVPGPLERARARRLRRRRAQPARASRRASPPPRRPASSACSSRSSARAGWTRCRCSRPSATRATRRCAARSRCRPTRRTPSRRTPGCAGTRTPAPLRDLHAAGKLSVIPAIGYDDPEPVALHLAPLLGGRRASTRPAASAGSAATSTATAPPTTRSRASRSTTRWRPSLATADVPVAAVSAPESYDAVDARRLGRRRCSTATIDALGRPGRGRHRRPRARHRPPRRRHEHRAARPARRAAGPHGRLAGRRRLPRLAERVPGPARLAGRDDRPRPAAARRRARRQRRLRHAREPGRRRWRTTSACCRPRWPPSRPTSRRAGSPTACSCTCGASSAAGRRPTARAPTTAPAARA